MELIELCLPDAMRDGAADRARAWCAALSKTPVEAPDQPGFVVNRLLFPYLFDAVRVMERTGMPAADVDACMHSAPGTPWARSGCSTSSGSTWPPPSAKACSTTRARTATGRRG